MKKYIIYRATCTNTNKVYIGYTNTNKSLDRRKYEHYYNAFNGGTSKFYKAIQKYPDQFIWECLFILDTHEEAKSKEIELIAEYDSYKNGYNSTLGGDGGDLSQYRKYTRTHIEENIQKDIVDMYSKGAGKAEIQRKHNTLTINMITKVLDWNNVPILPPVNQRNEKIDRKPNESYVGSKNSQYRYFSDEEVEDMINSYTSKKETKKQICDRYRMSYKIIKRIFLEHEIEKNPPTKYPKC